MDEQSQNTLTIDVMSVSDSVSYSSSLPAYK